MEQFSRRALGVGALYGLLSILFCLPLFARPFGLGAADWDRQLFYFSEVLKNVVEYRQAPFWSPWHCGGNVMWQHPSVPLLSPVYLLVAIMWSPSLCSPLWCSRRSRACTIVFGKRIISGGPLMKSNG